MDVCIQEAMVTLGFTDEEQMSMYKTISGILHFGNIEVKQRPREEWATIPNTTGTVIFTVHAIYINSLPYYIIYTIDIQPSLLSSRIQFLPSYPYYYWTHIHSLCLTNSHCKTHIYTIPALCLPLKLIHRKHVT